VTLEARQYADSDAFEERIRRLETHLPTQRRIEVSQSLEKDKPVADETAIGERIEKLDVALKQELANHLENLTSKFDALVEKLGAIENQIAKSQKPEVLQKTFLLLSFDINISGMRNIFSFRFNLWNTSNAAAVLSVREGWGERS